MTNKYDILKDICESRKSTRDFSNKKVSKEIIDKIEDIAKTTPYASGRKNWELVIVDNQTQIKKLAKAIRQFVANIDENINNDFKESFNEYAKSFSAFESAPVLVIPTYRISKGMELMFKSVTEDILTWERDNFVKSISCALMLVLLAAESLGLASCPMTGPLIAENEIKKIIKIKKGRNIGAIIPIGYLENSNE